MSDRAVGRRDAQAARHVEVARRRSQRSMPLPPLASSQAAFQLQGTVGNAATAAWLQRSDAMGLPPTWPADARPVVQRLAKPGDVDVAAKDLHEALVLKNVVPVEEVLQTLLIQKDQRTALRQKYADLHKRDLAKDLEKLGGNDTIRGQRYLEFGTLRPADKIYFTISGWGVDLTTMEGVLGRLRGDLTTADGEFSASYGNEFGNRTERLPTNAQSAIAGAVVHHMIAASFSQEWEWTKAKALLAYGTLRPADRARISVTGRFVNETEMLVGALVQDPNVGKLKAEYRASYGEELAETLKRETTWIFKEGDVAASLLDESRTPAERVIRVIKIAASGLRSAPDFIWQVLGSLTDLGPVKAAVEEGLQGKGELKGITDTFGGLSTENLDRLKAMVGIGGAGILADPDVRDLQKLGGTGSGSVFEVLKLSVPPHWEKFKAAYAKPRSPFERFVSMYCSPAEKGWLATQVFADTKFRINWTFENPGNTDYLVHIIANFTDSTTRRELSRDTTFMAKVKALGTANANKVLLALAPSDMTPLEKANWLNEAVGRETSSGVGSVTNAAAAVNDENRELQAAIGRAKATGKPVTDDQLKEINAMLAATEGSLKAFITYRDELESIVDSVVSAAVGLVLGLATGGAATVEFAVAAVARAAVASAMARVVSKKVVMGDRFDVLGSDGAAAFAAGAVDGALNVIAGVATAGVATEALRDAAGEAARAAAPQAFRTFAADTGKKMLENAVTGGLSSAVEGAVHDDTWAQGSERGLAHILRSSIVNAAVGAGVTGAVSAVMSGLHWNKRLGNIKTRPPDEQRALVGQAIDAEGVGPTLRKTGRSAEELRDLVGADTPAGRRISEYLSSGVGTLDGPSISMRLGTLDKQPIPQRGPLVQQALDVLGPAETLRRLPSWETTSTWLGPESAAMTRLKAWRDGLAAQAEAWASGTELPDPVAAAREYLAKAAGYAPAIVESALGLSISLAMQGGQLAEDVGVAMGATGASIDLASAFSVVASTPVSKLSVQRVGTAAPPLPLLAPGLQGFSGTDFEIAVAQALEAGAFAHHGLPKMQVVPGIHNESGNGIDLLGVSRNGDVVTFWVIECKFVREGGSWQIKLGEARSGTQLSNSWIRKGMSELLDGEDPDAVENRAVLERILRRTYKRGYDPAMMSDVLIEHIVKSARRAVVVPFYAERSRLRYDVSRINRSERRGRRNAVAIVPVEPRR